MPRTPQDITEAELAVLQVLWEQSSATIRHITDLLYPQGRAAQYATVQKLLERLESKGCVRRDRRSSVHVFAAAVEREELVGRRLQALAEKLCGGSWTPLLTHLVQSQRLSNQDRQALRALIDEFEPPGRSRKDGRRKDRP